MSILLTFHIVLMTISFITTVGMVVLALLETATPVVARRANLIATTTGIILGAGLLIAHPVGSRCIELTSYIVIFYFAYRYVSTRSETLVSAVISKY